MQRMMTEMHFSPSKQAMQAQAQEMERQQAAFRESIENKKKKIVPTMIEPAANVTTSDIGLKYNNRQKRGAMKNALNKIKSPTILNSRHSREPSMSSQDNDDDNKENEVLSNFLYSTKTMKVV
jgi:hypothetical protein